MTASGSISRWKRYLSPHFLADKVREKGIVWCLRTGALRVARVIYTYSAGIVLAYALHVLGVRLLWRVKIAHIGHLALEPDCYVKGGILGLHPRYVGVLLADRNRVANRSLLEYWKQYLTIIASPFLCRLLAPLGDFRAARFDVGHYASIVDTTAGYPAIQSRWGDRAPLLSLSERDRERGQHVLRQLGLSDEDWYVCVHCRERGYFQTIGEDEGNHDYRNADPYSYIPAMQAIVERSGWCIRLGDPTMKPLPPMERVIDYAHLGIRSDWMDIFLCASCGFLLGSSSGLYNVANIFGVPCAVANQAPMSVVLPYGPRDIGIPKLLWSLKEQRYLSFKEVLNSPIGNFRYTPLYTEAGVQVIDNSPDDIRDLALEMLERTEGTLTYTAEDERLQERFKSLMKPGHYSYKATSRVGRDFLRKYAMLLSDEELEVVSENLGGYHVY